MTTFQLLALLFTVAADIAKAKLAGAPAQDIGIAQGTLKLVQVAIAIQSEEAGIPIGDLLKTLQPYTPIAK